MSPLIIHLKKNQDPTIYVERAAEIIKEGLLVGYPMDNSYGLGVDPMNSDAIQRLIDMSGSSLPEQFFLFVSDLEEAQKIVIFNDYEIKIAKRFWPGDIMLVVQLREPNHQLKIITGEKNSITIGIPKHPILASILKSLKQQNQLGAMLCTFANNEEETLITDGKEMVEKYGMVIDFMIEIGKCSRENLPTIIEIDNKSAVNPTLIKKSIHILREGNISKQEILEVFQTHE